MHFRVGTSLELSSEANNGLTLLRILDRTSLFGIAALYMYDEAKVKPCHKLKYPNHFETLDIARLIFKKFTQTR